MAAFSVQVRAMAEAYMAWSFSQKNAGQTGFLIRMSDIHGKGNRESATTCTPRCSMCWRWTSSVSQLFQIACAGTHGIVGAEKTSITVEPTDLYLTSALVRHSLIPCSPITPKVAITAYALELYHVARQRCPHLSIQAYVKSLCDLHGVYDFFLCKIPGC